MRDGKRPPKITPELVDDELSASSLTPEIIDGYGDVMSREKGSRGHHEQQKPIH
jgi:hypothetical protein